MGRRLQAIATPHRGPTEQAVLALAGPHAMPLEGRRSRLRRRSGSGARDAGAGRRRSGVRRCRR